MSTPLVELSTLVEIITGNGMILVLLCVSLRDRQIEAFRHILPHVVHALATLPQFAEDSSASSLQGPIAF